MAGCTDESCAVEIGKIISADIIVIGSVNKIDEYIVSIKCISVTEGKVLLADSEFSPDENSIPDSVT